MSELKLRPLTLPMSESFVLTTTLKLRPKEVDRMIAPGPQFARHWYPATRHFFLARSIFTRRVALTPSFPFNGILTFNSFVSLDTKTTRITLCVLRPAARKTFSKFSR